MSINAEQGSRRRLLNELVFAIKRVGNELHGAASTISEMHVPGTTQLRTSALAPGTCHPGLDVHLYRPAPGSGTVRGVGRTIKTGRSVFVAGSGLIRSVFPADAADRIDL